MNKRIKKPLAVFLAAVMLFGALTAAPFAASAAETSQSVGTLSGTTGDCIWTLDNQGVFTISGNGNTDDYYYSALDIPWYYNRKQIKKVIISEGVVVLGSRLFHDCSNLKDVSLPHSLRTIAVATFEWCTSLNNINIPDNIGSIGQYAFWNTGMWQSQKNSPVYIDKVLVDYNGTASTNTIVNIKEGTKYIANNAFEGQPGIIDITIPDSVVRICGGAFKGTGWYDKQPEGFLYIGQYLVDLKGEINDSHLVIGNTKLIPSCFHSYYNQCNFESVFIPKSVKYIDDFTFYDCSKLRDVYYDGTFEEWNNIRVDGSRNEPLFNATLHLMSDYHFSISNGSNTISFNDEVTCAVSKTEGNLEGDFYDSQPLNWKSRNESVLKVIESKQDYSQCTVNAVGYGTSILSFYVGSVKIFEATIKVGMSQETLKDNSTLTLLKNAQKSGKSILSDYDAGDTAKVITFDVLTNLFDLAAEQLTVDFGGDTPEEKALDEVTQNIMKDYFGYNGSIEEQKLTSINEKWNCFKTAVKAVKKLRTQKKEGEAKKLAKTTIKQITKKGDSFGDKVINGFSKVSPYIDGAFTYYEIAMTAAMLQEFDKATVESLLNTFPKNTTAYTGLQRLYHDMTIGSEQYIVEKFTQETIISALSEFLEEVTFQGNEGLKEAYSSASGILSLVYEMSGGVTMKDISRARSVVAIAGNAYSLLSTNTDSGKREMIFNFCLSSIKVELENCIKVCKSSSASLKSSAQYYQGKVNKLTYEKYIKNCANEYTNPQGVSFENPDLEKYKISAKNLTNNKTSSPVGASEDESITNENELIIPSSTEDYLVTSISENGFANLEGITTIYIPESIEEIGDSAFYHCVDTQSITLGNNVTYIGEKAFMNCSNLSSINLNANLITIKASAFENCSKLTSAVLGKELSELGNQAFANCESLSTVFVFNPSLVIPDTAFENCGNLTIYGYSGSTAEKYANSQNISFESIGNNVSEIKVNYNGTPIVEQYGVVNADNLSLDITYIDGKTETITDGISVACNTSVIGKQNAVVVYESGYTTFGVDVVSSILNEISFDNPNYNMVIGDRIIPNVTFLPESTDYQVALTSSDESVISIEGDSIVAVGEGNAEITATTVDGNLNAKCWVTVGNNQAIDCSDGLFDPVFFIAPSDGKYSFSVESDDATATMVDSTGKVLEREEKAQNGILNFTETLTKDEVYLLFISSNENNDLIINSNAAANADRTDIDSMKVSVEGFEVYDSDYLQNVLANSKVTIFVNDEECYNDGTGTFVGENYTIKAADYKIVEQKSEFSEKPDIIVTLYFNESGYNWNVPKQVEFQLEYWDFNPQYQIGDTSLDGQISIGDVTAIQRHLAELALFTDEQLALADTNGDGRIDISDATHLQMYLAEYDVVLGKQ